MMDVSIIPECYVDTNLLETLIPPSKQYNHQKGCGTVAKVMKEKFHGRFALGIIDKDKFEIDYLKEFDIIKTSDNIILHKHASKPHYIIQINPAMEKFILANAAAADLNMKDFDLPDDMNSLRKISKTVNTKNDIRFKKLFKAILKNPNSDFNVLKEWIETLMENPYGNPFDNAN
jgi:hypothetical protein